MMKFLAVTLVIFATAAGGAAFAQNSDIRGDRADGPVVQSPARDAAIHDCSVEAGKYSFSSWQSTQIAVYGECMTEHNQPQ
jgi:hypothetical protein